jgi:hypothetical protein
MVSSGTLRQKMMLEIVGAHEMGDVRTTVRRWGFTTDEQMPHLREGISGAVTRQSLKALWASWLAASGKRAGCAGHI